MLLDCNVVESPMNYHGALTLMLATGLAWFPDGGYLVVVVVVAG